jgi:heterodisulfide reductase subunit A-like polyferredoxin
LGWGCAKYLINDVFSKSNHDLNTSIAILGGGIIGLSTAAQLVEKGYNVNLYANNFAYDTKANQP